MYIFMLHNIIIIEYYKNIICNRAIHLKEYRLFDDIIINETASTVRN